MPFTVAIVGRPNVGKSTLFNRLVGRRVALVDATPGVTRDRRTGAARIGAIEFTAIDTAGLEDAAGDTLEAAMRRQTDRALADADIALFVIDARAGITPLDRHFANHLRSAAKPVILIANKCDDGSDRLALEAYGLGLGAPIALSAEHGYGTPDLAAAIAALRPDAPSAAVDPADEEAEDGPALGTEGRPLQLAIVGRPNVGKSTLVNRLLGEERVITGPEPGITRDAIAIDWIWQGRAIRLIDTAGLRRRPRVVARIERLSVGDTLRAIRFAHVVVVVLDATAALEQQDLTIARMVESEGRALVLAVNKWDLVKDPKATLADIRRRIGHSLPQVQGVVLVTVSALGGSGLDGLLPAVWGAAERWQKRIATGPLNRWLGAVEDRHPPPLVRGRRVRLRYLTQVKSRPPTFALFAGGAGALPDSYLRYLVNGLRDSFDLPGVPIRINVRKGRNPFAADADEAS
ncbi:MAG: ribosome biogenesis GTPase Der [Alphaproteobacteria bacterium]|nr:ribosome biogenesis GTPase Der [Alphaproteobacteria bacterium]